MWIKSGVCPPCMYKTKHEPSLKYSMLIAMDGNNSLKLIDMPFQTGKPRTDTSTSLSPRWLMPEEVDVFQDNGVARPAATNKDNDENVDWLQTISQSSVSFASDLPVCVERWKNAGPDAKKDMPPLFSVLGIFLAVCHHGHVLAICDMIRSGEL